MHSTSIVHQSTGHQCGFNLQFGMHMEVALANNLHVKLKNHNVQVGLYHNFTLTGPAHRATGSLKGEYRNFFLFILP